MKIKIDGLNDVAETLLIPLYYRAQESERPDALVTDTVAGELVRQIDCDWSKFKTLTADQASAILRVIVFDRCVRTFLDAHPDGLIVNLGCGLDTRFQRVDNGRVEWYNLDLPPVIALRARLLGDMPRVHRLACSAFDIDWMDAVNTGGRACLFLSEGVMPYFPEAENKHLILALKHRFPGAELVFDALSPRFIRLHNLELQTTKVAARLRWGIADPRALERWEPGIRLLHRYYYFDLPQARRRGLGWMRWVPPLNHSASTLHYRLDKV